VSGHGFGHASRDVEVINALAARTGQPVVIRSAVDPRLLARTINGPYTLLPGVCDTGIVQSSSVAHDDAATVDAALAFYASFDERVEAEVARLAPVGPEVIVGDVPPLAFAVAARLGRPSVALANFTWDWIYEAHPGFLPRGAAVIDTIRGAYRQATRALELPFSGGFDVFPASRVTRVPLIARQSKRSRAETRVHFGLPADRPAALLSFGGYGMPNLDLARVDVARDWTVVTTDRVSGVGAAALGHVTVVTEDAFHGGAFRYEDLVAAVDVVLTKPGFGIVAECIAAGTPLVYTSRGTFREYDVLVREMPRYLRCAFISQPDLFAGRWRRAIDAAITQPPAPETIALDGAEVAAEAIEALLGNAPDKLEV
jgi:hypothetical protein